MSRVLRIMAFVAGALPAALSAQTVQDSYNEPPNAFCNCSWGATDVGWFYNPSHSYFLTGINTRFDPTGPGAPRIVDIEILTAPRANGGLLLASSGFLAISDGMLRGALFANFLINAGTQYFIGFRNVQNLGANFDAQGTSVSVLRYDFDLSGSYAEAAGGELENGILQFVGNQTVIPEPASMILLGTGLAGLAAARRRRTNVSVA